MTRQANLEGLALAQAGGEAAAAAAGHAWFEHAYDAFVRFAHKHKVFTTEDARIYAHNYAGVPVPPDARAWGPVANKAMRDGLVSKVGHSSGILKQCHAGTKTLWKVQE